jgi:TRAP-type C4-dicarboxylate transport system permease small subunit
MKSVNNSGWMQRADSVLGKITEVLSTVGASLLLVMMLYIVADVTLRGFFNKPIKGIIEITGFAQLLLIFLTLAYAQYSKRNITVDLLFDRLPQKAKTVVASLFFILSLGIVSLLARQGFVHFLYQVEIGGYLPVTKWPLPPFQFMIGFGWSLLGIVLLRDFLNAVFSFAKEETQ